MNPSFPHADAFNGNNNIQQDFGDTSSPNFIPSFPMALIETPTSTITNEAMGWHSLDTNELLFMSGNTNSIQPPVTNLPATTAATAYYSQPMVNNINNNPAIDNQHMMMLMMQQQQQQQQEEQQQQLLLWQQQQQEQQQLLMQQQQQLLLQQRQVKHRPISNQRQHNSNTNSQSPHWFIKQQQAKLMQEKLKASSSPSSQASSSLSMHNSPALSSSNIVTNHSMIHQETEALLTKRVEVILSINQEIIRLCLEHTNSNEPNLLIYQSRLQSNLTYLATMADISVTKPEDHLKIPTPPDLSPLPPAYTATANRIHALLGSAQQLFAVSEPSMSPYPQPMMFMRAQQPSQYKPQDFNELAQQRGNDNTVSNMNNNYYYNPQQPMMIMDDNTTAAATMMMYSNNSNISH